MSLWTFFVQHRGEILAATLEHLQLVVIAMAMAILIGVPLGLLLVHRKFLRTIALGIASILQTVPSLALFGFLIPIPFIGGIGKRTAIVALALYALLPILRNTYVGLTSIDLAVLESAEAMGMTSAQILLRVRFPWLLRSFLQAFVLPRSSPLVLPRSLRPSAPVGLAPLSSEGWLLSAMNSFLQGPFQLRSWPSWRIFCWDCWSAACASPDRRPPHACVRLRSPGKKPCDQTCIGHSYATSASFLY